MSERDEARAWLENEFSGEKFDFYWYDNPRYLSRCLSAGKLNFAGFFRNVSWTDTNIDLYTDYLRENNIYSNVIGGINSMKLFLSFVSKGMLENAIHVYVSNWTDELATLFAEKISSDNISLEGLKNASYRYNRNPIILKGVLDAGRFDLLDAFDINYEAWTQDNLNLLVSRLTDMFNAEEEINISEKILKRKEVYVGLIKNGIYDYASLFDWQLFDQIKKDPEAYQIINNAVVDIYNNNQVNDYMINNLFVIPDIFLRLIDNGIYDYLNRVNLIGGRINELYDTPEKIKTLIDAYDKIEESDSKKKLYGNRELGRSNAFLKKVLVSDDADVVSHYLFYVSDDIWQDDDIKTYLDKFANDFRLASGVKKSQYGLSLVLGFSDYSKCIHFDKSAWSRENILHCCENHLRDNKNSFYINIDDLYYLYLKNVFFPVNKKELRDIGVSSHNVDSNSLKNSDLLYTLGKLVVGGNVNFDSSINQFLSFIYEVKSEKIIYLMRYLIDDNLESINKLFDENGMTVYLYEHLLFDGDFRDYCNKNHIDYFENCSNKTYLQYLSFMAKYPEISKAMVISPENVYDYFDENGIKVELFNKLFRPNCLDLLLKLESEVDYLKLPEKKKYLLEKIRNVDSETIRKKFFEFVNKRIDDLELSDIDASYKIIKRIECSNSSEIRAFGDVFAEIVLERDDPERELLNIEKIFVQDKLPFVGKVYQVFKMLYPNYKNVTGLSNISPVLSRASLTERDRIIFNDLLRIELGSNNRNLQQYLVSMFYSNMLYEFVRDGKKNLIDLSNDEIKGLDIYSERVEYLCNSILGMNLNLSEFSDVIDKLKFIENKLKSEDLQFTNVPNYLVKHICRDSGFMTLDDLLSYSIYKPQMMDSLHRDSVSSVFKLEKGDFVKGIRDLKYLPNILQNGCVAAEFLGDSSNSDLTPLDTDLSLITTSGSIGDCLSKTQAGSYGPIYVVLKGNNATRFDVTRTDDYECDQTDRNRIEVFKTGALGKDHYGIRTGFASSEIDFIIASKDFEKIGFEIALNGVYIPVVDKEGNLKFTIDDYDKIRSQMNGLSHYGCYEFRISDNLVSDDIMEICGELRDSVNDSSLKRNAIYGVVREVLDKFGIELKTNLDTNLTHGKMEFLDTGSTGRGTNVVNDSDFDFIVRVDRDLFLDENKFSLVKKELLNKFGETSGDDFRLKKVKLDGVDEPLQVDMTFVVKSNKLDYATESCIQDRLNSIHSLYPDKYDLVLANIIFAKKFFKEAGCYKPKHAGVNPQGGFGGVGTENWILQHGGSFYDAAVDFVNCAATYPRLADFQKNYMVQDFGKNHLAEKRGHYPYDNFVYNLNEDGFEKMKKALGRYVSSKNQDLHGNYSK